MRTATFTHRDRIEILISVRVKVNINPKHYRTSSVFLRADLEAVMYSSILEDLAAERTHSSIQLDRTQDLLHLRVYDIAVCRLSKVSATNSSIEDPISQSR